MVRRCYQPNCKDYRYYGGKGIGICAEWLKNPLSFYHWFILQPGHGPDATIDRVDPDIGYQPDNCRLVTSRHNARWKSTTIPITANGRSLSGRQWAKELGLGTNYINNYRRQHGKKQTAAFITNRIST